MKEWLRGIILLTAVLTMSTIGISILLPVSVEAFSATEEVTMSFPDGDDLAFTVTNDYIDIVEFAIGNPDAIDAWVNWGDASPQNLTYGAIAYKNEGHWATYVQGYFYYDGSPQRDVSGYWRDLDWMDAANSGFAGYDTAFLFTSWETIEDGVVGSGNFIGNLETGFTDGYTGITGTGFASPVAAHSLSQGTINGGDAQVVPIPGAIWLLGSGLLGFVGIRRRK